MTTPKTKYEKKETKKTAVTFSADEIYGLQAGAYAAARRRLYVEKLATKQPNPRLDEFGREVLSPISMVADIDMQPLSTRQNLARFHADPATLVNGDGYDAETLLDDRGQPLFDDDDYYVPDPNDLPPTPHELRSRQLEKKLDRVRKAHQADVEKKLAAGDTPTAPPSTTPPPPKNAPRRVIEVCRGDLKRGAEPLFFYPLQYCYLSCTVLNDTIRMVPWLANVIILNLAFVPLSGAMSSPLPLLTREC